MSGKFNVAGVGLSVDDLPPLDAGRFDPRDLWLATERCRLPLELEIGSGKGTFLVQQAAVQPDTNFLGVEYAGEFYRYAAGRIRRHGLDNVRLLHTDARELVEYRLVDGCCSIVHVYFPDPWPKRRHHKRRMIQPSTLAALHRVLTAAGQVRIVTDHTDYWEWMQETVSECQHLFDVAPFGAVDSATDGELVGSNFERKYRREGRPFYAMVLRRRHAG